MELKGLDFINFNSEPASEAGGADFSVSVQNSEASLRRISEEKKHFELLRMIAPEFATACAVLSFFAFALAAADLVSAIPFLATGIIVYMVMAYLGTLENNRIKLFTAAGIAVVLIVAAILLRKYVIGGLGESMNRLFDASEAVQAYIYKHFGASEYAKQHPVISARMGAAWIGALAGLIASVPEEIYRRSLGLAAAAFSMIAFAYYGIIPLAAISALLVIAVVFVMAKGSILSTLPVLLASMLLFGAIMLINPGESYGISRMDENFRDRFALMSAYLEGESEQQNIDSLEEELEREEFENQEEGFLSNNRNLTAIIVPLIILLALAAAAYFLYRKYRERRDANREGLDSEDPRTAIIAMFPYAVKWLKAGELEINGKNFASVIPVVNSEISRQYAGYYAGMYGLWREAAYSDHPMSEEGRQAMQDFVKDTRSMITSRLDRRGRLKAAIKYAL